MLFRSSTQLYLLKMRKIPNILWMTNFILFHVQKNGTATETNVSLQFIFKTN